VESRARNVGDSLEEDDIDELTEDQPRVELLRHVVPPVPLVAQFGLEFFFPPARPTLIVLGQPSKRGQLSDDPFLFALFPQDPTKSSVIGRSPKGKVEQEERSRDKTGQVPKDDELQTQSEESELSQLRGEDGVR